MIPLPQLLPGWTWAVATVALMAGSALGGYRLAAKICAGETAKAEARRMECEQAREKDAREAAEKAAVLLARAQGAEAQAARRLAAAEAATRKKIEETRREIYRLATGRECLSGALRLRLNAAIGADDMPTRAGAADPAVAAAAAAAGDGDGGQRGSADADIAGWIVEAASLYDECRARIDALRHWDEVTHGR